MVARVSVQVAAVTNELAGRAACATSCGGKSVCIISGGSLGLEEMKDIITMEE